MARAVFRTVDSTTRRWRPWQNIGSLVGILRATFCPAAFFPHFHLICVHCVTHFRLQMNETDNNVRLPTKKTIDMRPIERNCLHGVHFSLYFSTYLRLFPAVDFRWASIWSTVEVKRDECWRQGHATIRTIWHGKLSESARRLVASQFFYALKSFVFFFLSLTWRQCLHLQEGRSVLRYTPPSATCDRRLDCVLCCTSSVRLWTENSWKKCCERIRSQFADGVSSENTSILFAEKFSTSGVL